MQIPLSSFEEYIDDAILTQGLAFYKKGKVEYAFNINSFTSEFIIHDTNDYKFILQIQNNVVTDYVCECPYDQGPVCKHLAAVIFYLRRDELMLDEVKPRSKSKPPTNSKPRVASEKTQITKLLDNISPEILKKYFADTVLKDKAQRSKFLTHFAAENENESQEIYNAQIKALLRTGHRRRYIDRTRVRKIGNAVHQLVTSAQQHLKSGNYRSAMLISCAVLEEMSKALEFADDSNGDIGNNIHASFDILAELTGLPIDENLRRELFQFCTHKFRLREFEGWDWHIEMMDLAANLQRDAQEAELIHSLLDQIPMSGYDKEKAQEIRFILMQKLQGEEAAQKFLEQHLNLTRFRVLAIDKAFQENEFEKVKKLALDGIKQDKKSKPGLLSDWYNALINAAIAEGDHAKVLEYAFLQLTEHGYEKKPYVDIIRKYTPAEDWPAKFESLITYLISEQHWQYRELIPELLVEEQDWERLISLLTDEEHIHGLSFEKLLHYGQYLLKDYGDPLGKMYEQELDRYATSASKRSEYKALIKYLRQLKKMSYGEMVNRLVTKWKNTYRYRPSMMLELHEM